jgi:hypothetical protein
METPIKELLDEYADLYFRKRTHNVTTEMTEERMQEIIKELEASIRKEVAMDLLDKFYKGDWVSAANALWTDENTTGYILAKEEFEKFLREYTLSNGITLK